MDVVLEELNGPPFWSCLFHVAHIDLTGSGGGILAGYLPSISNLTVSFPTFCPRNLSPAAWFTTHPRNYGEARIITGPRWILPVSQGGMDRPRGYGPNKGEWLGHSALCMPWIMLVGKTCQTEYHSFVKKFSHPTSLLRLFSVFDPMHWIPMSINNARSCNICTWKVVDHHCM